MQRHINAELHDNDSPHYAQLYLYDPVFATEQRITVIHHLRISLPTHTGCKKTETFFAGRHRNNSQIFCNRACHRACHLTGHVIPTGMSSPSGHIIPS